MKKARVTRMIKDEGLLILEIKKSKLSFELVRMFLIEIGFGLNADKILNKLGDSDNNFSSKRYSNSLYQDWLVRIEGKKEDSIVVFGKTKIFFSVHKKDINKIPEKIFDKYFQL